jgi:4-amino-4-deoxy-L-arabinose transferase-like glycosyltransferase
MAATSRLRGWQWLLLAAALAIFAAQAGWSSTRKSAAFDEQYHLAAGYAYLRTGDFRLATNHPPLAGLIAALPLLADEGIALPLDDPAWQNGDRFRFSDLFLWESGNDAQALLLRARWMVTLLGGLLLASLFFAARQMLGSRAGWGALLLALFEPNLIAHSRFVTTDLALTLFIFLTVWWWWRWLVQPRWANVLLAGLFAGLAMGAKYNGALVWGIMGLALLLQPIPTGGATWKQRLGGLVVAGVTATAVLWALFRFTAGPVSFLPAWLPLPAPHYWQWFWNTVVRITDLQGARVDFFLGEAASRSWWNYFFVASAVKLPLAHLLLAGAGFVLIARERALRRLCVLWLPPAIFLLLGATQVLNIGFRHMLPAIPFVVLLGASTAERLPWLAARPRRMAVAGALLAFWLAVDVARLAPHYESYFNQLAGPWQNWSNLLIDSNLDWGQDLIALREVMAEQGIDSVNLAYFGKAAPEQYGVRYRPLPSYLRFMEGREIAAYNPYTPAPGWYAISATALRTGTMTPETADLYANFRERMPDARAGYSIYLYDLTYPPDVAVARPLVLNQPLWTLTPAALGIDATTRAMAKWLETPESTVLPQGEGMVAADDPAFHAVNANFADVFTLLGYTKNSETVRPGAVLELTLFWEVGPTPMPQPAPTSGAPVSAFVHIVDGDPANKVAEFDSWHVALRGLEPGDVIAQRVYLGFADEVAPQSYDLLVGLYSPQDGQRLTTLHSGAARDYAQAGVIEVAP